MGGRTRLWGGSEKDFFHLSGPSPSHWKGWPGALAPKGGLVGGRRSHCEKEEGRRRKGEGEEKGGGRGGGRAGLVKGRPFSHGTALGLVPLATLCIIRVWPIVMQINSDDNTLSWTTRPSTRKFLTLPGPMLTGGLYTIFHSLFYPPPLPRSCKICFQRQPPSTSQLQLPASHSGAVHNLPIKKVTPKNKK